MKAAVLKQFGGPDQLSYEDFPDPAAGEGEVVVRVKACALNHLDLFVREGVPAYKIKLPHILGSDVAGIREDTGERVFVAPGLSCFNCDFCRSGRDNLCDTYGVFGAKGGLGGYAERIKVPERNVLPLPDSLSFEEGAAFPLTFLTAWHMLVTRGKLVKGQSVLVLGAGSGIGVAAIQIAKSLGATVIALTTQEDKVEKAKALGADHVLLGGEADFSRQVSKLTEGKGVDMVFEHVGPATFERSVRSLKRGGILVTCGATTGPKTELDLRYLFSKEVDLAGSFMGTLAELKEVAGKVAAGEYKVLVDRTFPLKEARQAQEYLKAGKQFGKIVLLP